MLSVNMDTQPRQLHQTMARGNDLIPSLGGRISYDLAFIKYCLMSGNAAALLSISSNVLGLPGGFNLSYPQIGALASPKLVAENYRLRSPKMGCISAHRSPQ